MLTNAQMQEIIHQTLISVWQTKIKEDYENGWLLREDTLKNALYFHLRKELEELLIENNLRIFTEYAGKEFQHSGFRPDMVIAKVASQQFGYEAVEECLAIIEIKFKNRFYPSNDIYADYKKLESYITDLNLTGHLYMATIWEYEDDKTAWLEDNPEWARGKVTELNASYVRGSDRKMQFYPFAH